MRSLILHLPDDLDFDDQKMTTSIAAKLYQDGKLSLEKAAEMAGISYREFIDALGSYGVSVFNYSVEDLDREFKTIESRHC